jgi:hypothetical protein
MVVLYSSWFRCLKKKVKEAEDGELTRIEPGTKRLRAKVHHHVPRKKKKLYMWCEFIVINFSFSTQTSH